MSVDDSVTQIFAINTDNLITKLSPLLTTPSPFAAKISTCLTSKVKSSEECEVNDLLQIPINKQQQMYEHKAISRDMIFQYC